MEAYVADPGWPVSSFALHCSASKNFCCSQDWIDSLQKKNSLAFNKSNRFRYCEFDYIGGGQSCKHIKRERESEDKTHNPIETESRRQTWPQFATVPSPSGSQPKQWHSPIVSSAGCLIDLNATIKGPRKREKVWEIAGIGPNLVQVRRTMVVMIDSFAPKMSMLKFLWEIFIERYGLHTLLNDCFDSVRGRSVDSSRWNLTDFFFCFYQTF